jgi:uridine monophosphate synthetase
MPEGFATQLEARTCAVESLLCVGLDPHTEDLKERTAAAALDFCKRLIDLTASSAAAFKPNAAFFEVFGPSGIQALKDVIAAVPSGIPVILDAKRGDIASTAQAYAQSAFYELGAGAVTINPYLGYDSIQPFLVDASHAAFLLCKTSNSGAADIQDLEVISTAVGRMSLFEHVARLANTWNQKGNLGLVVGATYPEALQRVRVLAPGMWFLVPGVGAQCGELEAVIRAGLRSDGLGLLINVSRGISRSEDPARAARQFQAEINRCRVLVNRTAFRPPYSHLADLLLDTGCVKFGKFTLKSGLTSPIYIDLRRLVSFPGLLQEVALAYLPLLRALSFDRMAALPYAAIPIATAISLQGGWPMLYPRKEVKTYGTREEIEGEYTAGETVVLIDDLATTGSSKFDAIEKLAGVDLRIHDVVVLIDRQSGATEALAERGLKLHAVFTLSELLTTWQENKRISPEQVKAVREFLAQTSD